MEINYDANDRFHLRGWLTEGQQTGVGTSDLSDLQWLHLLTGPFVQVYACLVYANAYIASSDRVKRPDSQPGLAENEEALETKGVEGPL